MSSLQHRISRARLTPSAIARAVTLALIASPFVASAQTSYQDPGQTGQVQSWQTSEFKSDWGLAAIGADYAYARGLSGAGITVGEFDDGTAVWHPELQGRLDTIVLQDEGCDERGILNGEDACFHADGSVNYNQVELAPGQQAIIDAALKDGTVTQAEVDGAMESVGFEHTEHGTHVAGTMVANRDGEGMQGVAFGAHLVAASNTSDSYTDVLSALNLPNGQGYAVAPETEVMTDMLSSMGKSGVRAINNSWGLANEPKTAADMDKLAATEEVAGQIAAYVASNEADGMIQVFAAGNDQGDIAGLYASMPRYDEALEEHWLSVVNTNSTGVIDPTSSICGLSKEWCIAAPGTDITSTVPAGEIEGHTVRDEKGNVIGTEVTKDEMLSDYASMTGTSMAAPHVTGGLALLMERFPYLDNAQVRDVLLTTAKDLGEEGVDEIYGWGLMDLKKAIDGPGELRVDTDVNMDQHAGGIKLWSGEAWDDWRNDIDGPGKLTKSGEGWLRLSGDNSFAGAEVKEGVLELDGSNSLTAAVQVSGGELLLNGQLVKTDLQVVGGLATVQGKVDQGVTTVGQDARLQGGGALSKTTVAGTIAPGVDGIGTLTVNGQYTQQAGSVYEVDAQAGGKSDMLDVRGEATLQGGEVEVTGATLGDSYKIVSAQSVSGAFAGASTASSQPFLSLELNQTATQVSLDVERGQSLASAASTSNQLGVAAAADSATDSNPMLQRLTQLSAAEAVAAFDQMSAETHASQRAALVERGQWLNERAASRLRMQQSAFAEQADPAKANGLWVDAQGRGGHLNADGNAARTEYHDSGITLGYDRRFGADWTLGALAYTGKGDMKTRDRDARSEDRSRAFGLYGGKEWGAFALRAGWLMSDYRIHSDRQVRTGEVNELNRANYTSKGQQGFAEAGYTWMAGERFSIEPYAQWSRVQVKSPGFQEAGSMSALNVEGDRSRVDFATGGVRFASNLAQGGNQDWLQLGGGLAYRHASGDLESAATASWQGGASFTSWSAPLAKDTTLVNLALGARLSRNTLLELGYDGQFASDAREHAVNLRYSLQF